MATAHAASRSTFESTYMNEAIRWVDANGGTSPPTTAYPYAGPVVVTSRLMVGGVLDNVAAVGSGTRVATVTEDTETDFALCQQAVATWPGGVSFSGNFAASGGFGTAHIVLTDPGVSRAGREMTITLDTAVRAAGCCVQTTDFGAYSATAVFKDGGGATLLSVTIGGTSAASGNNSAPFFGARSDTANIKSIVITSTNDDDGIAADELRLEVEVPVASGAAGVADSCGHPISHAVCVADEV